MFREHISKDTYIYMEELTALDGFELHPLQPIDIERPSSASKDHEVRWRLPFSMLVDGSGWVTEQEFFQPNGTVDGRVTLERVEVKPEEYPFFIKANARFDYHLRY